MATPLLPLACDCSDGEFYGWARPWYHMALCVCVCVCVCVCGLRHNRHTGLCAASHVGTWYPGGIVCPQAHRTMRRVPCWARYTSGIICAASHFGTWYPSGIVCLNTTDAQNYALRPMLGPGAPVVMCVVLNTTGAQAYAPRPMLAYGAPEA